MCPVDLHQIETGAYRPSCRGGKAAFYSSQVGGGHPPGHFGPFQHRVGDGGRGQRLLTKHRNRRIASGVGDLDTYERSAVVYFFRKFPETGCQPVVVQAELFGARSAGGQHVAVLHDQKGNLAAGPPPPR